MSGESKSSPRRIAAAEKQRQALELRKGGASYAAIAQALGYATPSGAQAAIDSALKKTIQEPAEKVRQLELERLDAMLLGLWNDARKGHQGAIDRVLRIMERRAKFAGLDAPVNVKHTGTGKDGEIEFNVNDARDEIQRKLVSIAAAIGADDVPGQPDAE